VTRVVSAYVFDIADFDALFQMLGRGGYTVVGPTVRQGAIVYGRLESPRDLPVGLTTFQDAGDYRLVAREDGALFGYPVGPHSWKKYLFPPRQTVWQAEWVEGSLHFESCLPERSRYAFLGVRACEAAAIEIQDRVFAAPGYADPTYQHIREAVFLVGVNCAVAGATCFCSSMGTGPRCPPGLDLVLTEIIDGEGHRFLVEPGTAQGSELVAALPGREATDAELAIAAGIVAGTEAGMGRTIDTDGIRELLIGSPEHPRWDEVAARCLACANCTLVCPTCFCSTTEDFTSLGVSAVRSRRWDSCFALDFSVLHGQPVRASTTSRYRQWLTHKLSTWYDQFGTSGCVGCGRCITWCPVGIDLTEEVAAIRSVPAAAT